MMTRNFLGFHMPRDGYGYATIQIAEALQRLEPGVNVVDMRSHQDGNEFGMAGDREWTLNGPAMALCTPDWLPYIHAGQLVSYTMFEASRLPAGWADLINDNTQCCAVPCTWCAQMFRDSGVRVPIAVVKWGINPAHYYPLDRADTRNRPYTFLWSGTADRRKGWDVAYRAFIAAFGHDRRMRLHLHFRDPLPANPRFADPNVTITIGRFDRPRLLEMLTDADCFVFPSRGEGWGSPPREAAATGLPTLVTDYGGLSEEIERWAMPIRVGGFSPAEYGWWPAGTIGEWPEPDIDHLAEQMRWCFDNPAEAARFGQQAAAWLAENATYARTARGVLAVLEGDWQPC